MKTLQNLQRRFGVLAVILALFVAPFSLAQTPGAEKAGANANAAAVNAGGNLGQGSTQVGKGAAPLPEPATWVGMGTLLLAVTALVVAQKRRRAV
jgi:hypothetical protein